jgi:hypothetical protein
LRQAKEMHADNTMEARVEDLRCYAVRLLRRVEARVQRSYLEQWNTSVQLNPMAHQ